MNCRDFPAIVAMTDSRLLFPQDGDILPALLLVAVGTWLVRKFEPANGSANRHAGVLAVIALFAYGILDLSVNVPFGWDYILGSVLRAILFAGLVRIAGQIFFVILAYAYEQTVGALVQTVKRRRDRVMWFWKSRQQRAEQRRRERLSAEAAEHDRRQADARRADEAARAQSANDAQARRENARAEVELFAAIHASQLPPNLGPAFVAGYMNRYLSDDCAPEVVEAQAARLIAKMSASLGTTSGAKRTSTVIEDLTADFVDREIEIKKLPISSEMKEHLLFQLRIALSRAIEQEVRSS